MPAPPYAEVDLARVMQQTWIERVHYFDSVESTNTAALQHARQSSDGSGGERAELFLAKQQTAGRGRGSNVWWSSGGALTLSVLTPAIKTPMHNLPQVSLTMGVAICQAVEQFLPASDVALKWPNDVYLNRRKVAGVLIELTSTLGKRMVVGLGLNVNNPISGAPPELRNAATSMIDARGSGCRDGDAEAFDLTDVAIACLSHIEQQLQQFLQGSPGLAEAWREYSLLTGLTVEIVTPSSKTAGVCQGIADDGALLVQTETGLEHCYGGVVARFG